MKKGSLLTFACLVVALSLPPFKLHAADHFVNIFASGFSPNFLTIAPGDNVFWINQDDFSHTVTSDDGSWLAGYLFDFEDVFGLTFPEPGSYGYFCQFDGFTGTILVQSVVGPANDQCSGAIAMTSGTVYTANTSGATSTGDPTQACSSPLGSGVWYSFTANSAGQVTVNTCGSDFDTVMAVYGGTCAGLTPVTGACNDDNGPSCSGFAASLTFSATAGATYWVVIGGYQGEAGNLRVVTTFSGSGSTWHEVVAPFNIASSLAQPTNNLVHIVDSTSDRLLTLNTETGAFISSVRLLGKTGSSLMTFSVDNQFLYVPLNAAQMLQVISLANLETWDLVPLSVAPGSLAAGSDGKIYAIANSQITKIDPATGHTLGVVARSFYGSPLIKANASGTRLFIMELGLSGGSSMIEEYAVTPGVPEHVAGHFNSKSNDKDFVIAEEINTLYSTSGGVYGIGVWDMINRTYQYWPFDVPYGAAVAIVPNGPYVYGASAWSSDARIRRFDKITGTVAETYDIVASGRGSGSVLDRSLKVTPNGTIFYARENRKIGLIGAPSLTTNLPPTAEAVHAGTNRAVLAGTTFNLNATAPFPSGTETYAWSTITGPGPVIFSNPDGLNTTVQIDVGGTYVLEIARTDGGLVSHDRVRVNVLSSPLRIGQVQLTSNRRIQFQFNSDPGLYVIEATADFQQWTVVTNILNQGQATVTDPDSNRAQRFYRVRFAPN